MNHGIPSPMNLFVKHTIQLVVKVIHAKKEENLVNMLI